MPYEIWTAVLATGMACGASLVGLLVVKRTFEPLLMLTTLACMAINTVTVVRAATYYDAAGVTIAVGIVSLAAGAGGYGLASALLPVTLGTRSPASVTLDDSVPTHDPGVVVLLLAEVEPEVYSPRRTAAELAELAEVGLREAGIALTPFLYTAQKARYRAMGGKSPAAGAARRLTIALAEQLSADTRFARVELVDVGVPASLARTVKIFGAKGYRRFIAAGLTVGDAYALDRAKAELDLLRPGTVGIQIDYTPPLWGSDRLAEEMVRRILAAASDPANTGVALVMHGQPDTRQSTHPTFDVQEDAYCNRIRMLLSEHGVPERNVRLCFQEWQTPDATETVRHLAAVGCSHVVVAPVCVPLDSAPTILDLPLAVHQARVDEHVTTVVLSAWGEHVVVSEVLEHEIVALARELEQDS